MTDNLRESISALMDDEANELEVRRILSKMDEEEVVRSTWKRYQLTRSAMNGQLNEFAHLDISQQVAAAIADEEVELAPEVATSELAVSGQATAQLAVDRPGSWSFAKPLTSLAVAASVAFMVVFGVLQVNQQQPGTELAADSSAQDSLSQGTGPLVATGAGQQIQGVLPASAEMTATQKRLRMLMERHAHQADISRGSGVMPYVQLVSQDKSQE